MKLLTVLVVVISNFNVLIGQDRVFSPSKSFSFIPVKNWKNYSEEDMLIFAKPLKNIFDIYRASIQIGEHPANGMNLEALWKSYVLRDFPKSFDNYKFIQMGDARINGKKAKWIICTNTANWKKTHFKNLVYMFVENDRMYDIICIDIEHNYENTEKEFRQMINSFEIK
jgi:hypothetical protein